MDWPAYSPDLNPIEHVWDALGRRIAAHLHHPENTQHLKQILIEEWALLPQEMLHQLVRSMRRRCEATIATDHLIGPSAGTSQRPMTTYTRWAHRVGRNQTIAMRICDRWMQEGTMVPRGQSHPLQSTTSLSARTIQRRLQQSGLFTRRPLFGIPLTKNHICLRRQWCDERRMRVAEWNKVVFTDESRICLQHHEGRIRVWRYRREIMLNSCLMHRHGPAPGIMVWGGIGYHSLALFLYALSIELLLWLARSPDLSPIENMWSTAAQRLTQITPPASTPDKIWQSVKASWSAVPQEHIKSVFESIPRRVAAVISNNDG
ncbi:transposable element Tcb1 transposase [Trichonephila clavipes]|nr:transposable element Tcb1 transposase [Trichonephila clavipes]